MRLVPSLSCSDLKRTIAFYTGILGFRVVSTYPRDGSEPFWCHLENDGGELQFNWDAPHEHAPGEEHEHTPPGMTGLLYLYPKDVSALYEAIKDKAEVQTPLSVQPYGMREFQIRDPDGYSLRFGEPA